MTCFQPETAASIDGALSIVTALLGLPHYK